MAEPDRAAEQSRVRPDAQEVDAVAFGLLDEGVAGVAGQDPRLRVDAGRPRGGARGLEGAFGVPSSYGRSSMT